MRCSESTCLPKNLNQGADGRRKVGALISSAHLHDHRHSRTFAPPPLQWRAQSRRAVSTAPRRGYPCWRPLSASSSLAPLSSTSSTRRATLLGRRRHSRLVQDARAAIHDVARHMTVLKARREPATASQICAFCAPNRVLLRAADGATVATAARVDEFPLLFFPVVAMGVVGRTMAAQ